MLLLLPKLAFCVTDVNHPPGVRTVRLCAAAAVLLLATLEYWRPWLGVKLSALIWTQMLVVRELLVDRVSAHWGYLPELWGGTLAAALAAAIWLRSERTTRLAEDHEDLAPEQHRWRLVFWALVLAYLLSAVVGQIRVLGAPEGWRIQPTDPRHLLDMSVHNNWSPAIAILESLPPVLLALMLFQARAPERSLAAWVLALGAIVAIEYAISARLGIGFRFDQTPPSVPFSNRNTTAPVLLISAVCGFVLSTCRDLRPWLRLASGVIAAALCLTALLTGSRNGIMVLVAVALLWLLRGCLQSETRSRVRTALAGLLVAVLLWALFLMPLPAPETLRSENLQRAVRGVTALREGDLRTASSDRLGIYRAGLQMFATYPLAGAGLATVPMALNDAGPHRDSITVYDAGTFVTHLHSMPLQLLAETGLLGAVAWTLAFLVFPVLCVLKNRDSGLWAIPLAALGVSNVFDAVWLTPGMPILAAVLLALALRGCRSLPRGGVGG
ncbi:MAG TPA: O-antigen ligase family protein [Planctomycetota bacterium]|nr:O-antigen ligase family protein [Planctomycetota bacterium]